MAHSNRLSNAERRRRRETKRMKYLHNIQLTDFRGKPMTWEGQFDGEAEAIERPLTPRTLFRIAVSRYSSDRVADYRDVTDALVAIEAQEAEEAEYLELQPAWYSKLNPEVDKLLALAWRVNAPTLRDQLDELVKAGKPEAEVKEVE